MAMRIIGHTVVRNEYHRYLTSVIPYFAEFCDHLAIYDDQSDDETFDWLRAQPHNITLARRPDGVPSFAEHEAAFRQAAWQVMEVRVRPTPEDWILCFDADELLVGRDEAWQCQLRAALESEISWAQRAGQQAVTFGVREVFAIEGSTPMIRTDGFWGQITAKRLVRYYEGGMFRPRLEGGGSLPSYAENWNAMARRTAIMHLGYAREEDRVDKHRRYVAGKGHNPKHVASILTAPTLRPSPSGVGLR